MHIEEFAVLSWTMLNRLMIFQNAIFPRNIQVHFHLKLEIIAFHIHFAGFIENTISIILMGPE